MDFISYKKGYKYQVREEYVVKITIQPEQAIDTDYITLSAEGDLIGCLYFEGAKNIKEAIRCGDTRAAAKILAEVVDNKPEKNLWGVDTNKISSRAFYQTGG